MNKPIWEPSQERIERANMNRFMRFVREQTGNEDIQRYAPLYDFSIRSAGEVLAAGVGVLRHPRQRASSSR